MRELDSSTIGIVGLDCGGLPPEVEFGKRSPTIALDTSGTCARDQGEGRNRALEIAAREIADALCLTLAHAPDRHSETVAR